MPLIFKKASKFQNLATIWSFKLKTHSIHELHAIFKSNKTHTDIQPDFLNTTATMTVSSRSLQQHRLSQPTKYSMLFTTIAIGLE